MNRGIDVAECADANSFMKTMWLIIVTCFLAHASTAQKGHFKRATDYPAGSFQKTVDLGLFIGTSNYYGEISNSVTWSSLTRELRLQIGGTINWNLSELNSLGLDLAYGSWYGDDRNHDNIDERNWYGRSNYLQATLTLRINLYAPVDGRRVYPYLLLGPGCLFHHTRIYKIENDDVVSDPGMRSDFVFSAGLGVGYAYNKWIDMGIELNVAFNLNDRMDNLIYETIDVDRLMSFRFIIRHKLLR
jgi:hypothetical protein